MINIRGVFDMCLEEVYEELRKYGLCESAYEFSRSYMKKSPSYYSVLKARNLEPSLGALCVLEQSLIIKASYYDGYDLPVLLNMKGRLMRLSEDVSGQRQGRVGNDRFVF
jgi:hypothetical protein